MSESNANNVNVTKLQQPSSVSIASEEPQLHPVPQPRYGARHALRSTAGQDSVRPGTLDYSRFDSLPDSDSDQPPEPTSPDTPASTSAAETKPPPTASKASLSLDGLQRNGGSANSHLWSQSRDEAIVHARAPSSIRGPSVRIQLYHGTLRIDASDFTEPLLHRQLAYRVHEPEHGDASEDFELTHVGDETFISVTLRKVHPASGVYVWWRHVFPEDPIIDTSSLEDRMPRDTEKVKSAWDKAMRMFKERRRQEKAEANADENTA